MKKLIVALLLLLTLSTLSLARDISNEQKIAGLYVAFFNRAPDMNGLNYWKSRTDTILAQGKDPMVVFKEISKGFSTHPVFTSIYGNLNNREFVEAIYRNVLGREGDSEGVNYWTSLLDGNNGTNALSRSDMVANFVNTSLTVDLTPQNFPTLSTDELNAAKLRQDLITNKTEVALEFVNQLGDKTNVVDSQNPENDPAYKASIKILSEVTEDSSTVQAVEDYIKNIKNDANPIYEINTANHIVIFEKIEKGYILDVTSTMQDNTILKDTVIPGRTVNLTLYDLEDVNFTLSVPTTLGEQNITNYELLPDMSTLTFRVPENIVDGEISLSLKNSVSHYTYHVYPRKAPYIKSISPDIAIIGDTVTISGNNLPSENIDLVFENQNNSFIQTVTSADNNITFTVPAGVHSGNIYLKMSQFETNRLYLAVKRKVNINVKQAAGIAFNPQEISFTLGLQEYKLDENNNTVLNLENNETQYINAAVSLSDDEAALLYSAVVLPDAKNVTVDANSTAIAWVFMGLGATSTVPIDKQRALYNYVSLNEKVQEFANYISTLQKNDFDSWMTMSDETLKSKFQDALKSVIQNQSIYTPNAIKLHTISPGGVDVTQDPSNDNIYIDMSNIDKGSVSIINDTKLYLSVEIRSNSQDHKGEIVNGYHHVYNAVLTDGGSLIGPQQWGLLDIASEKKFQLSGEDSHIEIITAGYQGSTDKEMLSDSLRARVTIEGMAIPSLNILLTTVLNMQASGGYKASNFVKAMRLMYVNGDFLKQLMTEISNEDSNFAAIVDTFVIKPVTNGLKGCFQPERSDICDATIEGLAKIIGISGTKEYVKNKIIFKIETNIGKSALKKSLVAVPVVGWIAEAAIFVYDNMSYISNTSTFIKSKMDMKNNPKEINIDVDFPLEVSSVTPLCVAKTVGNNTQTFQIGGKGFLEENGNNPEVYISETDASQVFVPTTGTDLIAEFNLDDLLANGSREDFLSVRNSNYSVFYPKLIRIISPDDSSMFIDKILPKHAGVGDTITIKGCGWVPLDDVKVVFPMREGSKEGEIISKTTSEIKVRVPENVISGLVHVQTTSKDKTFFLSIDDFHIDGINSDLQEGESFIVEGTGLGKAAHLYMIDANDKQYEVNIEGVTNTLVKGKEPPADLPVGKVRIYIELENGAKSNEITVLKLPKSPTVEPGDNTWFDKNLNITMTQEDGADIYYKFDNPNSNAILYNGPITLSAENMQYLDTTLYVFARTEIDGVEYDSYVKEYNYHTCDSDETLQYHQDGSPYCAANDFNINSSDIYTFDDWKLECPAGLTLKKEVYYQSESYTTETFYCVSKEEKHVLKEVTKNSNNNIISSEYNYFVVPHIGIDSFTSVKVYEYMYISNGEAYEDFDYVAKDASGDWGTYSQKSLKYYDIANKILSNKYEYVLKENSDGSLVSVATGESSWNKDGIKVFQYKSIPKQNSDGTWWSMKVQEAYWYDSGAKQKEILYEPKLQKNGYWYSQVVQEKKWYETGGISSEKDYTIKQYDDSFGTWVSVKIYELSQYKDDFRYEGYFVPHRSGSYGTWKAFPTKTVYWYPNSSVKKSETIYEVKNCGDPTCWNSLKTEDDEWYANGNKKYEHYYSNSQWDEAPTGTWREWNEDGILISELKMSDIQNDTSDFYFEPLVEVEKRWYDNGNMRYISKNEIVKNNSKWEALTLSDEGYYYDGALKYKNTYTIFEYNGKKYSILSKYELWYENGQREQLETYTPVVENGYPTNKLQSCTSWDEDGTAYDCSN